MFVNELKKKWLAPFIILYSQSGDTMPRIHQSKDHLKEAKSRQNRTIHLAENAKPNDKIINEVFELSIPGVWVLNSRSRGGKSHSIKYAVCINKHKLKYGLVFSNTSFRQDNFDYIPKEFKRLRYNPEDLKKLLEIQKKSGCKYTAYVIFDDCISEPTMWDEPTLVEAVTQSAHYNLWVIISTQGVNKVRPIVREGAFQVSIFDQKTKKSIDACYDSYGQTFYTVDLFKRFILDNIKEKYSFAFFDLFHDKPVRILKCPANIPKFMLKVKTKKKKKKSKEKEAPKGYSRFPLTVHPHVAKNLINF